MLPLGVSKGLALLLGLTLSAASQNDGYLGYLLNQKGDPESAVYRTANTDTTVDFLLPETPDVYLNATVNVESIRVHVANLVAKVDLDAKVLDLLQFTAGVDASIERVELKIDDVYARAELEARLGNVVRIVDCVLGSIDLNPVIASLGKNVGKVVGAATDVAGETAAGVLGGGGKPKPGGSGLAPGAGAGPGAGPGAGGGTLTKPESPPQKPAQQPPQQVNQQNPAQKPQQPLQQGQQQNQQSQQQSPQQNQQQNQPSQQQSPRIPGLLWWYTDRATNNRVNQILDQNGDVVEVRLDARGNELYRSIIGWYDTTMEIAGGPWAGTNDWGQTEYAYDFNFYPAPGVQGTCRVWKDGAGRVVRTKVLQGVTP